MHNYIHIPKTGGTALKYAIQGQTPNIQITLPTAGHNQHLSRMKDNVCFVIRDPWERFCSGFWERVTVEQRKQKSQTEYKNLKNFGYRDLDNLEKQILHTCSTPEEFLEYIRSGGKTQPVRPGIFELTGSITHWLGNMEIYTANEHKISLVFDIKNMNKIMKYVYNIDMPTDPFKKRSRKLFNIKQSYDISSDNLKWFRESYRTQDYQLLEHIKNQDYYTG